MPRIDYGKNPKTGEKRPSVTGIISSNLGWNTQPLMWWAWNEGMHGRNYRDTSQRAADVGTCAHAMVEADLKDKKFDAKPYPKDIVKKAKVPFEAWLEWKGLVDFSLLTSEESLISEKYQFGGTIDVAAIKKKICILDLKTSNGVYPDHIIQLAAYGQLWDEARGNVIGGNEGFYLLRLGKEEASFHYHYWPKLTKAWKAFKLLLELHKLQKPLRRM